MKRDTLLVIGARGQLGTKLTTALRKMYGVSSVIASDLGPTKDGPQTEGPYVCLNVLDKAALAAVVSRFDITQIYLFATKKPGPH